MPVSIADEVARQQGILADRHGSAEQRLTVPGIVRAIRLGAIWAGRKIALRAARSRAASVLAQGLGSIHCRRALLLEGTLSQLRRRDDDHSLFWAAAAQSYPDDPEILRMQLHSALRAGDAAAANAHFDRLLARGKTRGDDARFVVGLANIDLHAKRPANVRCRIRRFLASLRGSPEYRVAALRLSRFIFAHFPALDRKSGNIFRTRFLPMLDRSPVAREPKQLLRRIAVCENRLSQLYSGSFFETDISSMQRRAFVSLVQNRLYERLPFSFVRLGDGEAACLPYESALAPFEVPDARDRERIWWGKPLGAQARSRIYPRVARAVFDADCIGIPTVSRFLRELRLRRDDTLETSLTGRGLRAVLYCAENWDQLRAADLAQPVFTSCHLHQDLELWNCYEELFDGAKEVVLVSCHEALAEQVRARFGLKIAGEILLPPDRVTGAFLFSRRSDRAFPPILDSVIDELGDLPRGRLTLVGAGLLGKLIVGEARARGGIALDIGSIFDHWLGLRTRSYLDLNTA